MNNKQKAHFIVSATLMVGAVGSAVYDIHQTKKRTKRLNDMVGKAETLKNADLDALIVHLDQKLETARFWEIVTRDM